MAITNASTLAEYASGIGTQNSTLTVDSGNKRVGVGTTNPLGTFQVGSGVTFWGDAGIGSFTSLKLSGDTDSTSISTGALTVTGGVGIGLSLTVGGDVSVGGTITYEDVTNVDSIGIVTARSGLRVVGGGVTCVGVATFFSDIDANGALDVDGQTDLDVLNVAEIATFAADVSIADKIIHTGDTDTAIRFAGTDIVTIETAGTERLRIAADGLATFSGDANVNGTPPWSADSSDSGVLSLSGNSVSTSGYLRLGNGAATTNADFALGRIQIYNGATEVARITGGTGDSNNDTGLFILHTKSNGASIAERVKIKADGEIELGKSTYTSPVNILFNANRSSADDSLGSLAGVWNGDSVASISFKAGADTTNKDDGRIAFATRPSGSGMVERMRINESGQVGISTTNPSGKLGIAVDDNSTNVLATGSVAITLKNTNTTDNSWVSMDFNNSVGGIVGRFGAQFKDTSDKSTDLFFATRVDGGALSEKMRITSGGEIRIGGNEGGYRTNIIRESSDTTTAETQLLLYAKHDGSGNTGVGYGGGIRFWGDRNGDNAEQNMGRIMCIADVNSGTNLSGALVFETAANGSNAERMRITSAGICSMRSATTTEFLQLTSTNNSTRAILSASGKDGSGNPVTVKIGGFGDTSRAEIFTYSNHGLGFATNNAATQMMLDTDGRLLVAHTSSHADMYGKIQVCSNTSDGIDIARYTANAHPPYLKLFKSRNGTVGSNTATLANDNCGCITGFGNDGSGFHAVSSINFKADENSANDDTPGRITFEVTADGGTTLTERLQIDKNGTSMFQKDQVNTQYDSQSFIRCHPTSTINSGGRTTVFLGTSTAANYGCAMSGYRRGTSGEPTWELKMLNDSITGTQVEEIRNSGYHAILSTESLLNMNTSQDGSGSDYFARGSKNSTTAGGGNDVFWIYEDGDMYNVNGTFSQSSDIKLKENVVDAPSQWNDLKALKVRKFNFKASTGLDTFTQIGMVAQEVESTCPGLIKERVDLQKTTNSDGTVTETDTGEKTKSIKLTVLYMKAVKALQEAMTRIETLETENTDLKTLIKNSSSFAALKASL